MLPSLAVVAAAQRGAFTRAQAIESGYSPAEIRSRVTSGRWHRLRRGVLVECATFESARGDEVQHHLLRAAAGLLVVHDEPVLSHHTAARAWGLVLVGPQPDRPAMTLSWTHERRAPSLELHVARTPPHHRTVVDGLPVTTVARTLSDLARSLPFGPAVAAADDAFHRGLCTASDLMAVIADCPTWRGIARTKRVLAFADGRAESPGESLSRVAIAAAGLPRPELQVELVLEGQVVRPDLFWPDHWVVGEFDGAMKYQTRADLLAEKRREDLIRRSGFAVVRWTWPEIYPRPQAAMARLTRALTR